MQSICVFVDVARFGEKASGEKMLMSAELERCVTWFINFFDFSWVRYNFAKFYASSICAADFRQGGQKDPSSHSWAAPKKPILDRVNNDYITYFDCFVVEHILKETKIFINRSSSFVLCPPLRDASQNKSITANIFRIQAYDSMVFL